MYTTPTKRINTMGDMAQWKASRAYRSIWSLILEANEAAQGRRIQDECTESKTIQEIMTILDTLHDWVDDIPPIQGNQRFGNAAFRDWIARLEKEVDTLLNPLIPQEKEEALVELRAYFLGGFGHKQRLDYGSGHELSFFAFLACLFQLDLLSPTDHQAIPLRIFPKYLRTVRRLQLTYRLEPAGSHGVWGLDDYQFLPYIWGSAQLIGIPDGPKPSDMLSKSKLPELSENYLLFDCVSFIHQVKRGPFQEHSPVLTDISRLSGWPKANQGLQKMYLAEVLGKFPVIQHLPFGHLLSFDKVTPAL
ncbi:MAG: hypothetical protein DHS80DRAFT_25386 [Piptocephalis tieghemiana]|nr:MAG: hypothetical protein DHS80DRAFT_25386 [Piptocephalis tieghemiana]